METKEVNVAGEAWAWFLGSVLTALFGVLGWIAKVLVRLPRDYVPREQVNDRFSQIEHEIERDFKQNSDRMQRLEDKIDELIRLVSTNKDRT
jgi:hypothetical protein